MLQWPALWPLSTCRISPVTKQAPFEIKDRIHDVLDLAHAADRVQGAERCVLFGGMHRCLDDAGGDRVHADAAMRSITVIG